MYLVVDSEKHVEIEGNACPNVALVRLRSQSTLGGLALHDRAFKMRTFYQMHGSDGGTPDVNDDFVRDLSEAVRIQPRRSSRFCRQPDEHPYCSRLEVFPNLLANDRF